jgi:hypothetical protein
MKHSLLILLFITVTFFSCKKDDNNTPPVDNTPVDPYAANTALITPGADFYLIADVSGMTGVTKINWQASTVSGSKTQAYNGLCNGNEYHTGYIVGHDVQPNYFWFCILFQTTAASGYTDLVHTGDYSFCTSADAVNGIDFSFTDSNYNEWRCVYVNNNTISASSFKVTKYENVGGTQYLEVHFNCTLKKSVSSNSIVLSNAVFKAHW